MFIYLVENAHFFACKFVKKDLMARNLMFVFSQNIFYKYAEELGYISFWDYNPVSNVSNVNFSFPSLI